MGLFDKFQGLSAARRELGTLGIDPFAVEIEKKAGFSTVTPVDRTIRRVSSQLCPQLLQIILYPNRRDELRFGHLHV